MKILMMILMSAILSSANAASDLSVIKMAESGFEISAPKSWKNIEKKDLKDPIVLSLLEKNKEASLIVMATTENKMSCKDFLSNMDSSRGTKNTLAADKQTADAAILKASASTEAVMGEYEIQGKGPGFPVMQKSMCFKAKDQIRVLTAAYQKKKGAQHEPLFKEIFSSFKFTAKTEAKK